MTRIGPYELGETIASGGMGVVYRAWDPAMDRHVALKAIRTDRLAGSPDPHFFMRQLVKEAKAVGKLAHPNIVTVFQLLEHDGAPWLAMEFVEGKPLGRWLIATPRSQAEILAILKQAAQALDYAHSQGVIHRDVKPGNMIVTSSGVVKLIDFGIAKNVVQSTETMGEVSGSICYMAPEQIQRKPVPASDQFALAATAFEALSGKRLFDGETAAQVIHRILTPGHFDDVRGAELVPAPMAGVFRKALTMNPNARFASCTEFISMLEQPRFVQTAQVPMELTSTITYPAARSRPWLPITIVLGLTGALAAAGWYGGGNLSQLLTRSTAPPKSESASKARAAPPQTTPKKKATKEQPPVAQQAGAEPQPIAPPVTAEAEPPQPYRGRTQGLLQWRGLLTVNQSVAIVDGAKASTGFVTGNPLPGVDVRIVEVKPSYVHVREAPSASNKWLKLVLQNDGEPVPLILVRWQVNSPPQ